MNRAAFTFSAIVVAILLSYGLHEALNVAPTEATMGNVQRIFYYHVPSYATAFTMFAVNLLASVFYLVRRGTPSAAAADAVAVSAAELGVLFCSVGLMTGMLWAKPVWGIWWTWDARLTSTFVLWLIYVSYLMLRRLSEEGQAPTLAAALAIFGFVDVPIVYMSIRWWRTQHPQPVIFGEQNSGLDPSMVPALLINLAAFMCYGALLFWVRYKLERARQELREAQAVQSLEFARMEVR
ncbi:MAG: cytochrome C assembly protein [Acidobacteria bacterium]|nr:MAG: cytochrome C assembly protein [Acidobacteriota bacterium]PYY17881.1 MAG: cytochrome C assembly protein [Acidobacteriota bacterium]